MYRFVNVTALERLSCELDVLNYQKTRWVVVEFCTSVNSGMRQASKEIEHVCVVCITKDENGLLDETIALVRASVALWVERGFACWSGSMHWRLPLSVLESPESRLHTAIEAALESAT